MLYTINELRQKIYSKVFDVHEIFRDFFGEEYVDLQGLPSDDALYDIMQNYDVEESEFGESYDVPDDIYILIANYFSQLTDYPFILVHWPEVTVSNEHDKSIKIQDLYAKVELTVDGTIPYTHTGFKLNRATYSSFQFINGYVHSHLPSRYGSIMITTGFGNPCLGSGPIRRTIADLHNNYEEPLWMLFCQELALYVTVESLTGGPYRKLEQVGRSETQITEYSDGFKPAAAFNVLVGLFCEEDVGCGKQWFGNLLTSFTDFYLANGHLTFNFENGKYACGLNYYDYIIDISNAFIAWFNLIGRAEDVETLFKARIIVSAYVREGKFYQNQSMTPHEYSVYEGRSLSFKFKGEDVKLHIFPENDPQQQVTLLLDHNIAMYILQAVLKIINYHYRNEQYDSISGGETADTSSPTYQAVCYL